MLSVAFRQISRTSWISKALGSSKEQGRSRPFTSHTLPFPGHKFASSAFQSNITMPSDANNGDKIMLTSIIVGDNKEPSTSEADLGQERSWEIEDEPKGIQVQRDFHVSIGKK